VNYTSKVDKAQTADFRKRTGKDTRDERKRALWVIN
jgi:hypothetical protein